MIEKTAYFALLYDFYGGLLTDKQKDYLELYYQEDLSLGEIAQELQVSRQAVFDNIKRTQSILENYETQLNLIAQQQKRQQAIDVLKEYARTRYGNDDVLKIYIRQIEKEDE